MFFNLHLKEARKISSDALDILKMAYFKDYRADNTNMHIPKNVYNENYVRGFFWFYFNYFMHKVIKIEKWSPKKVLEFTDEIECVFSPERMFTMDEIEKEIENLIKDENFKSGVNGATAYLGVEFDWLRNDSDNPEFKIAKLIIEHAKEIIPRLKEKIPQFGVNSTYELDLLVVVHMLTIREWFHGYILNDEWYNT